VIDRRPTATPRDAALVVPVLRVQLTAAGGGAEWVSDGSRIRAPWRQATSASIEACATAGPGAHLSGSYRFLLQALGLSLAPGEAGIDAGDAGDPVDVAC
jgi:hypothetical protein